MACGSGCAGPWDLARLDRRGGLAWRAVRLGHELAADLPERRAETLDRDPDGAGRGAPVLIFDLLEELPSEHRDFTRGPNADPHLDAVRAEDDDLHVFAD